MREKDYIFKSYLSNPKYFAEFINSFIYGGKEIVKENELIALDTLQFTNKSYKDRDNICAYMKDGVNKYCVIGIESQSYIDYTMPIRCMQYDANTMARQYVRSKNVISNRLLPVITLVIFFSPKKWSGPRTLHEMYREHDEDINKYIPSYKMNLIEPYSMSDEEISSLTKAVRQIMLFEKYSNNREKLDKIMLDRNTFSKVELDTAKFIKDITNIDINIKEGEETIDMCKAWADQKEYGRTIGFNQGRSEGFNQGEIAAAIKFAKLLNWSVEETISKLVEISGLSKEEAEERVLNFEA